MELGMAHQCHYQQYEPQIERAQEARRATLNRAKDLPNLKILWLPGGWHHSTDGDEHRQLEEWKEKAVAEGMTCKLLVPTPLNHLTCCRFMATRM
ncbi:hypothetical protein FIBSPDRAFT_859191, partial [Athelia psychrophila]